ncbi:phosphoribosylglycinamide formyltransferase [Sphingorhabdus lacus]|jgi:phosphoribosylglycinamide formyltransferase 1|uniref:Phosphoribosylglycinamide formyltransferase n=1 Tax=Sphingorhabdus lacus TaxID=392610 RepID=A0A6I6LCH2_9SPHN|nr:phosphoribosylglycinamide formyltransferase [Sphingorhabdus lacus]QGY80172.1 phosphoribosylglycinamide formyltransferase [Sphingorhabdus lacus]
MTRAKVAVLISGSGTNMAALLYAAKHPDCPYEIVLVASNNPDAEGLTLAQGEGISTFAQSHKGIDRAAFDAIMQQQIEKADATHVALAGYMRILSDAFVQQWEGRMLNIHPSLLPKYTGLHTHQRALDAGDKVAGCSVHLVTPELDAGPVLGQTEVLIRPNDTAETLAERVKIAEHQLYPRILSAYVSRDKDPEWLVAQVRERAMAQPEADEVSSHGMPCFGIIGGKKFAYVSVDHHGDGKTALLVKISGAEEQAMLIDSDEDRYYRPAYFGDGWIGIRLDLGDTDWDHIADWLAKSWRAVAPKKLTKLMDVAGEF